MIETRGLGLRLGEFELRDLNLVVEEGEYFAILGPTGAGKTVLVECIVGLHTPEQGTVWLDGEDVTRLKPEERRIGYVPQDYALFPHLTVRQNIEFGLRLRRLPTAEMARRVAALVELLGIGPLLSRHPLTLSGGEKQRVALARALVVEPRVLLLDEPLAAVDERTRERLCAELRGIQRRTGTTTIHVSHNFEETLAVADRIGIFQAGRIVQVGTPTEIFYHPQSEFVAHFTRTENVFAGEVRPGANGRRRFRLGGSADLSANVPFAGEDVSLPISTEIDGPALLTVRPEEVRLSATPPPGTENVLAGRVARVIDKGPLVKVEVAAVLPCVALLSKAEARALDLAEGQTIYATLPAERLHVFRGN
jgi:ABC-type Fe3+/spermidine/putrescine transport system ATPase subunit